MAGGIETVTPTWQYSVIGWGLLIPGNLSMIGSSLIVYSILGPGRAEKLKKPHMRLMLGMSLWDIIYSFAMGYTFLMAPQGGQVPGFVGNTASCRMHGFLQQMSHNTIGYSALLSTYYWLTVTQGLRLETWVRFEPLLHSVLPLYVITLGAVCLYYRLYNQTFSICWVSSDPPGCQTGPGTPDCAFPSQPDKMHTVAKIEMSNMFASIGWVWITNFMIWWKVYRQERRNRMRLAEIEGRRRSSSLNFTSVFSAWSRSSQMESGVQDKKGLRQSQQMAAIAKKKNRRDRQVLIQSALYAGCFFLTWIGPVFHHIFVAAPPFPVMCIVAMFVPLQGFFNAFIYARPTYLRIRKKFPHVTSWDAFKRIFFAADPMASICCTDSRASACQKAVTGTGTACSNLVCSNLAAETHDTTTYHDNATSQHQDEDDDDDEFNFDPNDPFSCPEEDATGSDSAANGSAVLECGLADDRDADGAAGMEEAEQNLPESRARSERRLNVFSSFRR
ncbi:expressed unknown protein [Seminavis robusta]|uniref:Uncharacterized protein n=1 Tax=Seminavis robusta TaxID=568900 RepID=A0A9N8HWS0_9STRA|nr:expressed unknown protein [Seminavis robusta]|eukprot:Sro2026_g311680.1 n/a (502) ;mRNA; f:11585-13198